MPEVNLPNAQALISAKSVTLIQTLPSITKPLTPHKETPMLILPGMAMGGALAIALVRRRPTPLIDYLEAPTPPPETPQALPGQAEPEGACARLAELDDRYQAFVQTRIDPWLASSLRDQHMRALNQGGLRQLGELEKDLNRSLLSSVAALGLVGAEALAGFNATPLIIAFGLYTTWPAVKEVYRIAVEERRLSILHLMTGYSLAQWFSGTYWAAITGMLVTTLGSKVQLLTRIVTRHSLSHLFGEQPSQVWVVVEGGAEMQIPFAQLRVGDILVLDAGQPVPVDGVVVQGAATLDQHRLTGESQPLEKAVGDTVLAATVVLGGRVLVRVEKTGQETAAARIGDILNRTVDRQEVRLADYFRDVEYTLTPMLAASALGWLLRGPQTAAALLGCNYLAGTVSLRLLPLLNALSLAAGRGILVKDGQALETLGEVDTFIFDKTGTLTLERQEVVQVHAAPGFAEGGVLRIAAAAEHRQSHPIAHAIVAEAAARGLAVPRIDEAHYALGAGLRVKLEGALVRVGSQRFLEAEGIALPEALRTVLDAAQREGHALVFVALDGAAVGGIELAAALRPEAQAVVDWLKGRGYALYILSGDQEAPTAKLAGQLGMDGYFANTMPAQKAFKVKELQEKGRRVCFVGDGINDAVALLQADVSISFRGGTTVASDAAQVVLMEDHLEQIQILLELAAAYNGRVQGTVRRAKGFSLAAGAGVLLLPKQEFKIVPLLWIVQLAVSLVNAERPLLESVGADEPLPAVAASHAQIGQ
jgi:heavy metal translocating P-type ATPase